MADAKLTALTAASALAAADLFYVSQSAASRKATGTQLLALVGTTYVPLAGGTMTGALTIASGTLTASAPALNITQTWNDAAVSFVASDIDVTATAYFNQSYLIRLRTNGTVRAFVDQNGYLGAKGALLNSSVSIAYFTSNFSLASSILFGWTSGVAGAAADVVLARDAPAQLALRNGTNAQRMHIYGTYTDSSNLERLTLSTTAGTSVNITAETLGTGGDNLDIVLTPAGTGKVGFPGGASARADGYLTANGMLNGTESGVNFYAVGFRTKSTGEVAWTSGAVAAATDTALFRGAAGQVDVTNGTAATYRDLKLRNLLNTEYHQMTEMTAPSAPATNSVRIYAEDNGAGKTRLMALFATGSAVQIAVEP